MGVFQGGESISNDGDGGGQAVTSAQVVGAYMRHYSHDPEDETRAPMFQTLCKNLDSSSWLQALEEYLQQQV